MLPKCLKMFKNLRLKVTAKSRSIFYSVKSTGVDHISVLADSNNQSENDSHFNTVGLGKLRKRGHNVQFLTA